MADESNDLLAEAGWCKSLTLIHQDTEVRPASLSYVKPQEYRQLAEALIDRLLARVRALEEADCENCPRADECRGRCGAFYAATGETCIRENDHGGEHVMASDIATPRADAIRLRGAVRALLLLIGEDGKPYDGFRFRELALELAVLSKEPTNG